MRYSQEGAGCSKSGVCAAMTKYEVMRAVSPVKVIRFGASQQGNHFSAMSVGRRRRKIKIKI